MNRHWEALLQYQSTELVKRRFNERHGRVLNTASATSITSAVTQGREYFNSAANAAMAVRPLLLYYGVLALTRALVLFVSRNMSEAALKPAHGLEINDWQRVLVDGWRRVADLRITIRHGTFTELLKATSNKSYLRVNSSGVNWKVAYSVPPNGTNFTFGDLSRCIPETLIEFEAWVDEQFAFAHLQSFKPGETAPTFEATVGRSQRIDEVFPESLCQPRSISESGSTSVITGSNQYVPFFVQYFGGRSGIGGFAGIGDVWIVPPLPNRQYLSTLGLLFSLSFTLGMLVRYFPSVWVSLGTGGGDSVAPLVHQLLALIESKYPQLVVDHLKAPYDFETAK